MTLLHTSLIFVAHEDGREKYGEHGRNKSLFQSNASRLTLFDACEAPKPTTMSLTCGHTGSDGITPNLVRMIIWVDCV